MPKQKKEPLKDWYYSKIISLVMDGTNTSPAITHYRNVEEGKKVTLIAQNEQLNKIASKKILKIKKARFGRRFINIYTVDYQSIVNKLISDIEQEFKMKFVSQKETMKDLGEYQHMRQYLETELKDELSKLKKEMNSEYIRSFFVNGIKNIHNLKSRVSITELFNQLLSSPELITGRDYKYLGGPIKKKEGESFSESARSILSLLNVNNSSWLLMYNSYKNLNDSAPF